MDRTRTTTPASPEVASELRQILAELEPALNEGASGTVQMHAEASGSGRVYQAGRDQHVTER